MINGLMSSIGLTSYLSPKLAGKVCPEKGGKGVFSIEPVSSGETLVVWGGEVLTGKQLEQLPISYRRLTVQIEDELYLVSSRDGPGDWINHSCDPNSGLSGQIVLTAMRDIAPGEEICFDYAMADGSPYDEFNCSCGSKNCRGQITGNDWQRPELWGRYAGYFSPYLQRKIQRFQSMNRR